MSENPSNKEHRVSAGKIWEQIALILQENKYNVSIVIGLMLILGMVAYPQSMDEVETIQDRYSSDLSESNLDFATALAQTTAQTPTDQPFSSISQENLSSVIIENQPSVNKEFNLSEIDLGQPWYLQIGNESFHISQVAVVTEGRNFDEGVLHEQVHQFNQWSYDYDQSITFHDQTGQNQIVALHSGEDGPHRWPAQYYVETSPEELLGQRTTTQVTDQNGDHHQVELAVVSVKNIPAEQLWTHFFRVPQNDTNAPIYGDLTQILSQEILDAGPTITIYTCYGDQARFVTLALTDTPVINEDYLIDPNNVSRLAN